MLKPVATTIAILLASATGIATAAEAAPTPQDAASAVEALKKATADFNAAKEEIKTAIASRPADEDRYDGDKLELKVNICKFKRVDAKDDERTTEYCAPAGSVASSKIEIANNVYVFFKEIGSGCQKEDKKEPDTEICPKIIKLNTQYYIARDELPKYSFKRTGIKFGAMIVPFKFRMGGRRELVSSATVAPYIGFSSWAILGTHIYPVFSAGLSVVPVTNTSSGTISSKAAPTLSTGFLLSSDKNSTFTSGILVGWDFLSTADRKIDPDVNKAWLSLFVGYGF